MILFVVENNLATDRNAMALPVLDIYNYQHREVSLSTVSLDIQTGGYPSGLVPLQQASCTIHMPSPAYILLVNYLDMSYDLQTYANGHPMYKVAPYCVVVGSQRQCADKGFAFPVSKISGQDMVNFTIMPNNTVDVSSVRIRLWIRFDSEYMIDSLKATFSVHKLI